MRLRRTTWWIVAFAAGLPALLAAAEPPGGPETAFRFARSWSPLLAAVLCAGVAFAGWWTMRKEAAFLSKPLYWTLVVLRVLPFILVMFLLLKPVLVYQTESTLRQQVAVLVDESESMAIADKVFSRVQLESAAYLLGLHPRPSAWPPKPESTALPSPDEERAYQSDLALSAAELTSITATSRVELVRRALAHNDGAVIDRLRRDYSFNLYGFADASRYILSDPATPLNDMIADLSTTGPSTRLGTALQRVVQNLRGQPVAGIVVISDGRNVAGVPPDGAAEIAGDARIPIYAIPVGAGGSRDVSVTAVIAESVVFKDDEFPVSAKLSSRGYDGFSVPVILEVDDREADRQTLRLTGDEQLVTFRHSRSEEGKVTVRVRVLPQEAEESAENNFAEAAMRIVDKKIKILMVEEIPRWDFRYLRNTLLRDPHVEVKQFLQQADREVAGADPNYVRVLPSTEKELFEYDLLILGGLRPRFLREEQMQLIESFVSKMGGGVIFLAVENISPDLFAGTPLEPLLPVRLTRDARPWLNPDRLVFHGAERRLALTPEGRSHNLVAFEPEAERNERVWRELPPHYWIADVGGLKPAAQVLVESVAGRDEAGLPAVVTQPYGLGRILYIGTDSTWRWRYKVGDRYFVRFWAQAVQYLTLSRLLEQNKRLQVVADRETYEAGETVSISVRALDSSFQPRTAEELPVVVEDQDGKRYQVRAYLEPDRDGMYSAVYKVPYEGQFTVTVEDEGATAQLEFEARRARLEMREPQADWATMARIAERSGGAVVTLDHLDELPRLLGSNRKRFEEWREQAMWDWWPFLTIFVFFKTLELSLRKYKHLK